MTRKEFTALVKEAEKGSVPEKNYYFVEWQNFIEAWRYDKRTRWYLGKNAAICIIRYQCIYLNGDWDLSALKQMQMFFRNIDVI